ncbi:MAG: EF-P beta-lysylation protein EpmB [Gammaproteobacteria bacterium]|nr:EF-P beta-lysylation protein EpmB [Gammaproteobacteria bacterium]
MQHANWQSELQHTIRDPAALLERMGLSKNKLQLSKKAVLTFPMRVPPEFADRIRKNNTNDPLLLQVLPVAEEEYAQPDFSDDPLAEQQTQPVPGLLHKYHGRALLIATGVCAIHCRYCFRRHFPYSVSNPVPNQWQKALDYLRQDTSIREIILSGGDPLTLSDQRLSALVHKLAQISHLRRLRIHTRIPIVLPVRINKSMLQWLTGTRLKPVMVVHANHANELDNSVAKAIDMIRDAHVPLFNQSVLLRGVNDSAEALINLSEALFNIGIIPYYLHMLDPVQGAAHFDVTETRARQIMCEIREKLPGYLVPRLVREYAGAAYKIPI